ncbi:MAG: RlpA-like double-psi beta-barrel domain-containing protein [Patescibacteria group bacterium]|jgi:D-alanyl-D-alanine carboxypeptidase
MFKKLFLFSVFILLFSWQSVSAEERKEEDLISGKTKNSFSIFLDKTTISKGYTVSAFSDYLKLSLVPGILSEDTNVFIEEIREEEMGLPWNLKKESSILQFEFLNKQAYDNHKPFYIQFSYDSSNSNFKQVFFYDKNFNAWRPLPTWDFPEENFVRSLIHLPFARIAVFSYPEVLVEGEASWYKFKGGKFAASPDFPKGSLLRVYNTSNKKFVDVIVNDFGPDKSVFPNRILDLDYVAFKEIASSNDGLINVSIEPLNISVDNFNRQLNVDSLVRNIPEIKSASAIVFREKDSSVVFGKEIDKTLPIASLTKIFSVFTFLKESNNRNRLEEIVKYDIKDEEYNLRYFKKWEIALINLKSGDQLSIKDVIYSALVRSANNMVETLVRVSGLDRDLFIEKTNNWAKENGANSFSIKEPTGLDKNNVASSLDLALLSAKVFSDPIISNASVTKEYRFVTRNDNSLKLRYNSSDLVLNNNYKNFKIIGSKTGYLDEAGYCLITRAEIRGEKFIVVILNSSSRAGSFKETIDLLNYVYYQEFSK